MLHVLIMPTSAVTHQNKKHHKLVHVPVGTRKGENVCFKTNPDEGEVTTGDSYTINAVADDIHVVLADTMNTIRVLVF